MEVGASHGHSPQELLACQTSVWRTYFPHSGHPAVVIELTPEEEAYLTSDGIMATDVPLAVPAAAEDEATLAGDNCVGQPERCESPAADGSESGAADAFAGLANLKAKLDAAVQALGGRVVPKANWSSPKDAVWISIDGLRCRCADEVLLLLKSSDRIAHDLDLLARLRAAAPLVGSKLLEAFAAAPARTEPPSDDTSGSGDAARRDAGGGKASTSGGDRGAAAPQRPWPAELVLKKAFDLDHGREFRCFVAARRLVGACQRDPTQHFPPLLDHRDAVASHIVKFHLRVVAPSRFPLSDYTYDVYVTSKDVVRLVDFNPVGAPTQPLLFAWDELYPSAPTAPGTPRISDDLAARHPSEEAQPGRDGGGGHGDECSCCLRACGRPSADASEAGHSSKAPEGGWGGVADGFELRIVEEAAHLQAGSLAYGAPFDVVGMHGMAWGEVIEHMRQHVHA